MVKVGNRVKLIFVDNQELQGKLDSINVDPLNDTKVYYVTLDDSKCNGNIQGQMFKFSESEIYKIDKI